MIKKVIYRLSLGIILLFLISSILVSDSFAQVSIGVKPTIVELSLAEEEVKTGVFIVGSSSKGKVIVRAELENWYKNSKSAGNNVDIKSCITIDPAVFELNEFGIKEVNYKVKMPKGFKGELAGMIFFEGEEPKHAGVNIRSRFGVTIYAIAKGTEKMDIKIDKINVEKKNDYYRFDILVKNFGNIHIRPKGNMDILNSENILALSKPLPFGFPVLPGSSYTYTINIKDSELAPGKYYVDTVLNFSDFGSGNFKETRRIEILLNKDKGISITKE